MHIDRLTSPHYLHEFVEDLKKEKRLIKNQHNKSDPIKF